MAGSIFIAKELRVSLSTRQFDYLVERIRASFDPAGQPYLQEIYSPMDDGGMNFISAEDEGEAGFKAFFEAIARAESRAREEESHGAFGDLWNDLLGKIRLDARFRAEWENAVEADGSKPEAPPRQPPNRIR